MKQWIKKYKTLLGISLCICGLILVHRNILVVGLPAFIVGFLVLNGGRMPWSRR
jgi:hypothetical protein